MPIMIYADALSYAVVIEKQYLLLSYFFCLLYFLKAKLWHNGVFLASLSSQGTPSNLRESDTLSTLAVSQSAA